MPTPPAPHGKDYPMSGVTVPTHLPLTPSPRFTVAQRRLRNRHRSTKSVRDHTGFRFCAAELRTFGAHARGMPLTSASAVFFFSIPSAVGVLRSIGVPSFIPPRWECDNAADVSALLAKRLRLSALGVGRSLGELAHRRRSPRPETPKIPALRGVRPTGPTVRSSRFCDRGG